VLQTLFLDVLPITEDAYGLRILGTVLYFVGLGTAVLGRVQLGKNWIDLEEYQVLTRQSVTTTGIYRYIRHPIYSGDILLLIGLELALNSWLVIAVLFIIPIVVRQVLVEEAILAKAFPQYRDYVLSTRRFIPFVV
jgi:protein-S-isoprenylcysteine O-methyltransferase Ste14